MSNFPDVVTDEFKNLVYVIINRYPYLFGKSKDDLEQEGFIGLYKAYEDYDSSRGVKFKTFAYKCILSRVHNFVKKELNYINKKEATFLKFFINNNTSKCFLYKLNGFDICKICINKEEEERNVKDNIEYLFTLLGFLKENERTLISEYYGIGKKKLKIKELAERYKVNQRTIKRRIDRICKKLKDMWEKGLKF